MFIFRNLKYIFNRYSKEFFFKSYLISYVFISIFIYYSKLSLGESIALIISAALYPFVRFNYFYIKYKFCGNYIMNINILVRLVSKFIMFMFLLAFSIPIGIIDIIYILMVNNSQRYIDHRNSDEIINQIINDL